MDGCIKGKAFRNGRSAWGAWQFAVLVTLLCCFSSVPMAMAAKLAAGGSHTCVIADDGNTYCWGSNTYRQLGDGTQIDRDGPVRVTALSVQPTAIAAGWNHNCVITPASGAQCWGLNQFGQLGNGNTNETDVAVDVIGLSSGVAAITGGRRHGCAVTQSGKAKCWGANDYGQLGTGDTTASSIPVTVSGLDSGVVAIAGGDFSTCAILSGGALKCWGRNESGQLGIGTQVDALVPTPVTGLSSGVVNVSIHSYGACAVLQTGALKCWGYYLGDGDLDAYSAVPVDVLPAGRALSVHAGYGHRCMRTADSSVACWGEGQGGEIGDGALVARPMPTPVTQLAVGRVIELGAGIGHACALLDSGEVRCWGGGYYGQLGHGRPSVRSVPVNVRIQGGESVKRVALGSMHACAVTASSGMQCWGGNFDGQLGDGTTASRMLPTPVSGALAHQEVSAGASFTCSVAADVSQQRGTYCWGNGSRGELGNGGLDRKIVPTPVRDSEDMSLLSSRTASTCAILSNGYGNGYAKCWGENTSGKLGFAGGHPVLLPDYPNGLLNLSAIAMGEVHACAIQFPGTIQCWGANNYGQLGDGTTSSSALPVTVAGLGGSAVSVSAGFAQTCAVIDTGAVKCWGLMFDGTEAALPTVVPGLETGVRHVSLSANHACVLRVDGTVRCWGRNGSGQLGDASFVDRTTPVEPVGLGDRVVQVVVAEGSTCAVLHDGSARCWGSNDSGQLGNGEAGYVAVPERVSGTPFSGVIFRNGFE